MNVVLKPETESRIREIAAQEGKEPEALVDSLLAEAIESREESARTMAAIQKGLDDFEAGRCRPASEFFADMRWKYNLADPDPSWTRPIEVAPGVFVAVDK
jgi:predicted transcriptional regulator